MDTRPHHHNTGQHLSDGDSWLVHVREGVVLLLREVFAMFVLGPDDRHQQSDSYLGRRLKQARVDAGLSRAELCARTGMTMSRLVRAENGELSRWLTAEEIERVAAATGVNPSVLT